MEPKTIVLMTIEPPAKSFLPLQEKRIPLDIASLTGYLKERNHRVMFIDNYLKDNPWENILESAPPDFLALYLTTECWSKALETIDIIKEFNDPAEKKFKLIAFGPSATFSAHKIPEYIDYVIQGEPEIAMENVLQNNPTDRIISGPIIEDINTINLPDWETFIPDNYPYESDYDLTDITLGDVFPVFDLKTNRGTENNIAYLPLLPVEEAPLRLMSVNTITQNIQHLLETYHIKGLRFLDYNLAHHQERLIELCNQIKLLNLDITWNCSIQPGSVDSETLALMKEAGCVSVKVPFVSGSQQVLDILKAEYSVSEIETFVSEIKKAGMQIDLTVMYGVPHETESDRQKTESFITKLAPDFLNIKIFVGLPGSELYEEAQNLPHRIDDNGIIIPLAWESLMKKYLNKSSFSGNYNDIPIASNPIPSLVFYKKGKYIQEKLEYIDTIPIKSKVYFYGAGKLAKSFVKKYKLEEYDVKGFLDEDLSKGGRFRPFKFKVYHASEIKKLAPDFVFITMASRSDSFAVKEAIMSDINLDKKPEIISMFFEEV
jgi:radical SAM superfamily enzyme YgiQ (UPF0313 family)